MRRKHASVQASLPLDDIVGDVVRLRGGDCRAILEAGSVNFALKSEAEQEAILAGYRRFLNGLSYPLQVLVRIVPTDVEGYLEGIRGGRGRKGMDLWRRLAVDHETFVRTVARERSLLDRRCYVVVPAGTGGAHERTGIAWPWRRHRPARETATVLASRRALAFRCAEVAQGLAAFGVTTRRLEQAELISLWRAALAGTSMTTVAGGVQPGDPAAATPVLTLRLASRAHEEARDA
ncbi:MAG: hypothetical protein AMXMBFR23_03050 [Chloroflexota bacterium]